jgi:hydrogenase expression/formation protein HypC
MCVGVPMKVTKIDYPMAEAEAKGVKRSISLMLLPEDSVKVGDYVMVHVGSAIEVIEEKEAKKIWEALDQVVKAVEGQGNA